MAETVVTSGRTAPRTVDFSQGHIIGCDVTYSDHDLEEIKRDDFSDHATLYLSEITQPRRLRGFQALCMKILTYNILLFGLEI